MHPRRALGFGLVPEPTPVDLAITSEIPPPLVPDVSSESDESDGFASSLSECGANAIVSNPLAFLPFASLPNLNIGESIFHSPESPSEEDHHYHRYEEEKRRRRKRDRDRDRGKGGREQCPRQRARGSTRDIGSKPTSGEGPEEDDDAEDDDIAECQYKSFTSLGGWGLGADDETCLGGF